MTTQWTKIEDASIPNFTIANITNYFITRVASDGKPANDFKNLNSHAYPLFKAGHIQSINALCKDPSHIIRCSCLPEMKKDTLYKIEITLDRVGDITQANCACPAGSGPFGSCKHIGALCYALEEFCRIKLIRQPESCTSQLQRWNQPRKRRLDPCDVDDIMFVKYEYGKTKKQAPSMAYDPRPSGLTSTAESEIELLRKRLSETKKEVALLHLLPLSFPTSATPLPDLPPSPPLVRDRIVSELSTQPQPVSCQCIAAAGMKFLASLQYSHEQVTQVEVTTRAQRLCSRWQQERQFRITASKFGTVVKRRRNHNNLAKQMLYSQVSSGTVSALLWGQQHEADALASYKTKLDCGLTLNEAGIFISECGFLGASPDGVVTDHLECSVCLVEVKCPYKARNKSVEEMYDDPSFCCSLVNGEPVLKQNHDYYYQVQGQMAITGVHVCDFVVWTPTNFIIIKQTFNETFWKRQCYPLLKDFYFNIMLPEIVYPKHPELPFDYTHLPLYS